MRGQGQTDGFCLNSVSENLYSASDDFRSATISYDSATEVQKLASEMRHGTAPIRSGQRNSENVRRDYWTQWKRPPIGQITRDVSVIFEECSVLGILLNMALTMSP